MPEFLTIDQVFEIHTESLRRHGGSDGLRDRGLLESAVASPQASFGGEYLHTDVFEMAAAYAFHIAENQPFIDGNKRTAFASASVFLDLNGYVLQSDFIRLYDAMIAISAGRLDKPGLAALFRELAIKR